MSFQRCMDKQIVVRPYAAIKMEQTIDIYILLSERSQSPNGNLTILYDCIYTIFSKRQNYRDREQVSNGQGTGGIGKCVLIKRQHKRVLGGDGTVLYPNCTSGYIKLYLC